MLNCNNEIKQNLQTVTLSRLLKQSDYLSLSRDGIELQAEIVDLHFQAFLSLLSFFFFRFRRFFVGLHFINEFTQSSHHHLIKESLVSRMQSYQANSIGRSTARLVVSRSISLLFKAVHFLSASALPRGFPRSVETLTPHFY